MQADDTNRRWWTLGAVCVATFMLLLDITVVNTALPAIQQDLGGSFADLQWVIDAYALSLAALVLTAGSLADRLGRRRVFAIGLGVFSLASLLCALAPDPTLLNLARGLQGVGGAIMFAVSLALVAQEFPSGPERGMAMGVYGATIGIAVAIGPLVGGLLTDGLGWESVFLLNVPIGIAALAVTYWKLAESRDPNATAIDWGGLLSFSTALFLLVLALVRGNAEGWGSAPILSLFAAAALLLVAFVAIERRVAEPMLPLGLFRRRAFTGVQLAAFAVSGSMFALFLYLTLYLQSFLGFSPIEAGVRYLPITLGAFIVAPFAGMALARVQARYLMSAGLALTGAGLLLMGGLDAGSEWTALLAGFVVAGIGVGLINPVVADVALSVVPKEQSGMAAGINDTFRQVGVAVGIAAWGAIFLGTGASKAQQLAGGSLSHAGARDLVEATSVRALPKALAGVPDGAREATRNAAEQGFLHGLNEILLLGAALSLAGSALALWLVRESEIERERSRHGVRAEAQPEPARPERGQRLAARAPSGSLDLQLEGSGAAVGGVQGDAQLGLAADGEVEPVAEAEAVAGAAQDMAGRVEQAEAVAAAAGGAQADQAVERCLEGAHGRAPMSRRHPAAELKGLAARPGAEGVFANRREGAGVGLEAAHPAPGDFGFREAHVRVALGESLAGVAEVVQSLVAGEQRAGARAAADVLVARPARRAPVERHRERRRRFAVAGDVVPVLVREDEFAARPVRRRRAVAVEENLVLATVVTGLRPVSAVEFDLARGVELHGQPLHLVAVRQRAEEVGELLRVGGVADRLAGGGGGDRHGRAAAVVDRVAARFRGRRDPRRAGARRPDHRVAPHLPARRSGEEEHHGHSRKRPRRALAQGAGPGSIS